MSSASSPHIGKPLIQAYLGLVAFAPINLVVLLIISFTLKGNFTRGALFAATVAALAALFYFVLRRRAFAAGLVGGYLLLTIFSAGSCTGFTPPGGTLNALIGLLLYLLAIVILGIALLIARFTSKRW